MADANWGAIGGGILGGAAGFMVGGPVGAAAGAGIGSGLGGYLSSEDVEYPGMVSDLDIQREMPDVWRMIQQNKARISAGESALEARRAGLTNVEKSQLSGAKGGLESQQAHRGTLGSSVGMAQSAAMQNSLKEQFAERAFQEEMQRRNYVNQLEQQQFQNVANARNQLMAQRQGKYQADMGNQQASNQFYGSLMNTGLGMGASQYAAGQNRETAYKIRGLNPDGSRPSIVDSYGSTGDFGRQRVPGYYGDEVIV